MSRPTIKSDTVYVSGAAKKTLISTPDRIVAVTCDRCECTLTFSLFIVSPSLRPPIFLGRKISPRPPFINGTIVPMRNIVSSRFIIFRFTVDRARGIFARNIFRFKLKRLAHEPAQCYLSRKYRVSSRGGTTAAAHGALCRRKRRFPATRPGSGLAHPFLADLDLHLDLA